MFSVLKTKTIQLLNNKKGVTTIEYAILAAALAVLIAFLLNQGGPLYELFQTLFDRIKTSVDVAGGGGVN